MFKINKILLVLFLSFISIFFTKCKNDYVEVREDISTAENNAKIETDIFSNIDIILDWVIKEKKLKKATLLMPSNIKIKFNDSSFTDKTPISGYIEFMKLGKQIPLGVLCGDGKYRSGKIHFQLSKPITEKLEPSSLKIFTSEQDSFFTGNGVNMHQHIGEIDMNLTLEKTINIVINNYVFKSNYQILTYGCNYTLLPSNNIALGIWGATYKLVGNSSGTTSKNDSYKSTIIIPLEKKLNLECSKIFISGTIEIVETNSKKTLIINYDPFKNKNCDYTVQVSINGKKTLFDLN